MINLYFMETEVPKICKKEKENRTNGSLEAIKALMNTIANALLAYVSFIILSREPDEDIRWKNQTFRVHV